MPDDNGDRVSLSSSQNQAETTGCGMWCFDVIGGAVDWCQATRAIHDVPADFTPTYRNALSFYPDASRRELRSRIAQCIMNGISFQVSLDFQSYIQRETRVQISGRKLRISDNRTVVVGNIEDLRGQKSQSARTVDDRLAYEILDAMPSGVVVFNDNDHYVIHNKAYTDIFPKLEPILKSGTTLTEMLAFGIESGEYATEIKPDAPRLERLRWVEERAAKIRGASGESREVPLGGDRWIQSRERRSPSGHLVCVRTDITRLKKAEAEARRLAEEDELTGIPNRRILFERLEACLHRRRKNDQGGAFALFDLDHFKQLNDLHGHDVGDAVLREIARRATRSIRDSDVVARLGGDEFALILPGLAEETQAAKFLRRFLDSLRHPITIEDLTLHPSISVGIVFYPTAHQTSIGLYRAADHALYAAKRNGRNGWAFSQEGPRDQR